MAWQSPPNCHVIKRCRVISLELASRDGILICLLYRLFFFRSIHFSIINSKYYNIFFSNLHKLFWNVIKRSRVVSLELASRDGISICLLYRLFFFRSIHSFNNKIKILQHVLLKFTQIVLKCHQTQQSSLIRVGL